MSSLNNGPRLNPISALNTRRSRALGDISNKEAERDDSNKGKRRSLIATADDIAPRRSSSRLKAIHETVEDGSSKDVSKICFDDTDTNTIQAPRRTSARLKDHQAKVQPSEVRSNVADKPDKQQTKRRRSSEKSPLPPTKKSRTTHSKETMELASKEADERLRQLKQIDGENLYAVHPDFRLHRDSFDGKIFTYGVAKHDVPFLNDTSKATPYVTDIFQHLYKAEGVSRPKSYMSKQDDINSKMRAILIDWLVEVHMKFRLVPETLYLCVNIIDRYCALVNVKRSKLQLVGVTALLIACKYEEIYPPEVRDCVYITDRAYQNVEVLDMEQDIVHKLEFKITVPTAYPFLQRFLSVVNAPALVRHAANYYTERTLQEHDMLKYRPSLVCASAIILAMNHEEIAFEEGLEWNPDRTVVSPILLEYTGFKRDDLIECANRIAEKVAQEQVTASNRQLIAVKKKYSSSKFSSVAEDFCLPSLQEEV